MNAYFTHICMMVPSERGKAADWKTSTGAWDVMKLKTYIQTVKESHFDVQFPLEGKDLGLVFNGRKVIKVHAGSVAARCGLKADMYLVKIRGTSAPSSTATINAMIRLAIKQASRRNSVIVLTFRPLTAREKGESQTPFPENFRPELENQPTKNTTNAPETSKLQKEIERLRTKLQTEEVMRANENQQAEIWKKMMTSQVEELEQAGDKAKAEVELLKTKMSRAEMNLKSSREEASWLREQLADSKSELRSEKEKLSKQTVELKFENQRLNEALKEKDSKIDEVTGMFETGQSLMRTATRKIELLEAKLKKAEGSELKAALERKDHEINNLRAQVKELVSLTSSSASKSTSSAVPSNNVVVESKASLQSLQSEEEDDASIHGVVLLLVSYCAGIREKSQQDRLRHLFAALEYKTLEVDGAMNPKIRRKLTSKSGLTTYPQVFVQSGKGESAAYLFVGSAEKVFEMNEHGRIHVIFKGCERQLLLSRTTNGAQDTRYDSS